MSRLHRFIPLCLVALPLHGEISGPYSPDADTAHLFHFDEAAGQNVAANAVGSAASAIAFDGNPALNHASNPQPAATSVLGAAGHAAFGLAATISAADLGIGLDGNGSGGFQMGLDGGTSPDAVLQSTLAGADGSFTVEALVKLPSITGATREIVSTDNSLANNLRGFQFRIDTIGRLEFNFIGTNTSTSTAAIPTSGSHAFVAGEWFHAALSHNGVTKNTVFYWTRLAATSNRANAIGISATETTAGAIAGPLVIGNEARSAGSGVHSGEGLLGLIDEVRISKVVRGPGDFIFVPGEEETDGDGDGLTDAWEMQRFGTLDHNGGSDPDGDGFGNLQELQAGTDPAAASSRPPGVAVKLVPVDDGDAATSEFGFAGPSAINTVSFVRSSLKTVGNQQFITWYGRHEYDPNAPFNNTIWIGRRTLGSSEWEVFRHPTFTANNINDGHDVICYGIDGNGFMHVSWGMHGDAFHYSRSTAPVTGEAPIVLGPDTTMTGREDTVTYPQFLKLPDGDLLFIFREAASGNGDTYINRYDTGTGTWDNVHRSGNTQLPFIKGTGWTPNYNAYPNMPQLGGVNGDELILTWCWRYEPVGNDSPGGFDGYQTNNNFAFGRSTDGGLTWRRHDGTQYNIPVTRNGEAGPGTAAEHIFTIPEGSSLINQASMCLDGSGNPVVSSWWAPGATANPANHRRQYMVGFRHGNGTWQSRPVSARNIDPTGTRYSESFVRNLGRPVVVNDDADRVIVAYRDNDDSDDDHLSGDPDGASGDDNGLTVVHSLPLADDPDRLVWIQFDLTRENLGNFEPIIDNELWDRDRQLHFLHQASAGEGYAPPSNTAARVSVLEWDADGYFSHQPQPSISFNDNKTVITLTCPSQPSWSYRLWTSTGLGADWEMVETRAGTGEPLVFTRDALAGETKRFWRIEYREGGF